MSNIEKRAFGSNIEIRAEGENETPTISGYASVFNRMSENLGGFREIIAPGAFDNVLDNDVRALFNHDANFLLARTASGTLRLSVDEEGLRYEFEPPNTTAGRDLVESMKRGDITQSSFAFTVRSDSWEERDGTMIRTIDKVDRLFDVSPVTYPAYPDASVGLRSLQAFKEAREEETVSPATEETTPVEADHTRELMALKQQLIEIGNEKSSD